MAEQISTAQHEIERGRILQILLVRYPDSLSFADLKLHLVRQGCVIEPGRMGDRVMAFHLAYLKDRGYVALEKLRAGDVEMGTARLTARGVDLMDGRIERDSGVAF
ncbi:MAG TPA: hypothetical protein VGZ29_05680 [Terriglobia bacterium]|nr:hypothetical protein [Terriglobia bacterium]